MKDKQEKEAEENRNAWQNQKAFIADFRKALEEIIHPAMSSICDKLRKKRCLALSLKRRRGKSNPLLHVLHLVQPPKIDEKNQFVYKHYENYYISGAEIATGFAFILTIVGNYPTQKVCVFIEYIKHQGNSPSNSIKKTMEQYELREVSVEFIDTIITTSLKELLSLKEQST